MSTIGPRPINMNKDDTSWAQVKPATALGGSTTQAENVLAMALADIARLARHCDALFAELTRKIPKGWRAVPEEMTGEMARAWMRNTDDAIALRYRAVLAAAPRLPSPAPFPRYRHYKGGIYEVVGEDVMWEPDCEAAILYRSLETGSTWCRLARVFHEEVSPGVKRFTRIGQS